jgi:hypothetical protein
MGFALKTRSIQRPSEGNHTAHNAWFRAKVRQALDDPRRAIAHDEVEAHFAKRRATALRKVIKGKV